MPKIQNEVLVDAPLDRVFELAKDVESFPKYMPDVESVKVIERSSDDLRTVTEWVGVASDFKLKIRWTEADVWNNETHTCHFAQTKGDYAKYEGEWLFEQVAPTQTKFRSAIDYEIDIPLIGPLLKALVAKLMRENTQRILEAVKRRAEQS